MQWPRMFFFVSLASSGLIAVPCRIHFGYWFRASTAQFLIDKYLLLSSTYLLKHVLHSFKSWFPAHITHGTTSFVSLVQPFSFESSPEWGAPRIVYPSCWISFILFLWFSLLVKKIDEVCKIWFSLLIFPFEANHFLPSIVFSRTKFIAYQYC